MRQRPNSELTGHRAHTLASSPGLNTGIHKHHQVNTMGLLDTAKTRLTFSFAPARVIHVPLTVPTGMPPQTPLSQTDILSERTLLRLNFEKDPYLSA